MSTEAKAAAAPSKKPRRVRVAVCNYTGCHNLFIVKRGDLQVCPHCLIAQPTAELQTHLADRAEYPCIQ